MYNQRPYQSASGAMKHMHHQPRGSTVQWVGEIAGKHLSCHQTLQLCLDLQQFQRTGVAWMLNTGTAIVVQLWSQPLQSIQARLAFAPTIRLDKVRPDNRGIWGTPPLGLTMDTVLVQGMYLLHDADRAVYRMLHPTHPSSPAS
jgi:hypothetical protein